MFTHIALMERPSFLPINYNRFHYFHYKISVYFLLIKKHQKRYNQGNRQAITHLLPEMSGY